MTSIFKSNKFFRIIKHFVLTIPLMVVLGTSIYTIVNPNAKDSYDDIQEVSFQRITNNSVIAGESYFIKYENQYNGNNYIFSPKFFYSDISINWSDYGFSSSYEWVRFQLRDDGYVYLTDANSFTQYLRIWGTTLTEFTFTLSTIEGTINQGQGGYNLYFKTIINGTLNNAFTYGMYKFNQVGFSKFDFVGLFDGIFTDNIHNVYTDFVNSYINYYLMIECVYFAPWVIHMFIHFAYDLGDYFTSSFKRNRKEDD